MPDELFSGAVLALLAVSFLVGIVVGLTGMGGGALTTPALVFLGIPPTAAVANDLVAAAVNKSVGAVVHARSGSPDWRLVRLLVVGSVPFALGGAFLIDLAGPPEDREGLLRLAIGVALLLAAATYALRIYGTVFHHWGRDEGEVRVRVLPTIAVGAVGGLLVGLTSVGSGSIIMVALLLLHPGLAARRLVGTDLVQAVPLVLAAAVGHVIVSGVTWTVLLPLVLGGDPGDLRRRPALGLGAGVGDPARHRHRAHPDRPHPAPRPPARGRCDRGRPARPGPPRVGRAPAGPRAARLHPPPGRRRPRRLPRPR